MGRAADGRARVLDPASPLYKTAAMPNLRRLASQGASFLNTYITSPQCVPSRTTMMTGLRNHRIQVWDNTRAIASVDGDPTQLDHHCVASFGESLCSEWAVAQKAPRTFPDMLHHAGRNVTLYGKLHTGAGLDQYEGCPGCTTSWSFWGAPATTPDPETNAGLIGKSLEAAKYWSRATLIEKPPGGATVNSTWKKLTVPDDVALPMVSTTAEICLSLGCCDLTPRWRCAATEGRGLRHNQRLQGGALAPLLHPRAGQAAALPLLLHRRAPPALPQQRHLHADDRR